MAGIIRNLKKEQIKKDKDHPQQDELDNWINSILNFIDAAEDVNRKDTGWIRETEKELRFN